MRGTGGAVVLRRADHQRRGGLVGLHPRCLRVRGERWPGVGAQRRDQGLAHRVVHCGLYPVLAVVPAELAQVPDQILRAAQALHDQGEGPEQPVSLRVHGRREQAAQMRVTGE